MSYAQSVRVEGDPLATPVPVSGTVTSNPSGTQNVAVTGQPLSTTLVKDPSITGVYVFSADEVPGVVAANNYLTIANPVGSGKTVAFVGAFLSSSTAGGTTVTAPMRGFRANTISGGTLQAVSTIAKFITANPNPVAEIRLGNPTATLDGALFNSPPPLSATQGGTPVHTVPVPGGTGPFILAPGEGIVFRQSAGDTDIRWNLSVVWAEI